MRRILIACSDAGARLFRNQAGVAYQGDATRFAIPTKMTVYPGDVLIRAARTLTSGLCVGASDCIGWNSITITSEMVGRRVAVFAAVECKSQSGRLTPEQARFLAAVKNAGGIAIEARDVEAAINELKQWGEDA